MTPGLTLRLVSFVLKRETFGTEAGLHLTTMWEPISCGFEAPGVAVVLH